MGTSEEYTFAELLRQFRVREKMSQRDLSDKIGVHRNTVGAWEHGNYLPETTEMISKIAEVLLLSVKDEQLLLDTTHERITLRSIWNIPYQQNPLFTGREAVLAYLHTQFQRRQTIALTQTQAIHGLGGIGKTQTAVEYAYRHRNDYQVILWVQADTQDALISGFIALASLLRLPERDQQEQERIVDAVKEWLGKHTKWLLILDNVDDISLIKIFLPTNYDGHVLLTTRSQALGDMAQGIVLERMKSHEAILFLLRRAKIIGFDEMLDHASAADQIQATTIIEELGGLPLALDQAGAYIEETGCSISGYLERYNSQRTRLLKKRGRLAQDHLQSVASTFSLSFEKVSQNNRSAIELLRLSAFLYPDAIPEQLIIAGGAPDLGSELQGLASDPVALDEAMDDLRAYSLVHRNATTKTFSIHRLVQAILKGEMSMDQQGQWAERAVRIVAYSFPDSKEVEKWSLCEQYLLHAQACANLVSEWNITSVEAAQLLHQAGRYLYMRGRYREAERLTQSGLAIREQLSDSEHLGVARSHNQLAAIFYALGNYESAESFWQRAFGIYEKVGDPFDLEAAHILNNLASLYWTQGKYNQAEQLNERVLMIREQVLGSEHIDIAQSLQTLAILCSLQGKYEQAEELYHRSLALRERILGPDNPEVAQSLNNLAELKRNQGKYEQAEQLNKRALMIREQILGPMHPEVAHSLINLGLIYYDQGKYEQAEPLQQRALDLQKSVLGPKHTDIANSLNNLALLYYTKGNYEHAKSTWQEALSIREQALGPNHPRVATILSNLGEVSKIQGEYEQAEHLYQQASVILEQALGNAHPDFAKNLNSLASLYYTQEKYEQAEQFYQQAIAILKHSLGFDHPDTAFSVNNLAELYDTQGKYEQAEQLYQQALASLQQVLGPEHPHTVTVLNNYATLLRKIKQEE